MNDTPPTTDPARLEALMTGLRVWFIGFLDAFADLLGEGPWARAWRRWIRAELDVVRQCLRAGVAINALRDFRETVTVAERVRTQPHGAPRCFRLRRARGSALRFVTRRAFRWTGACVRGRIAQVWAWLADPAAAIAAIRARYVRGRADPGLGVAAALADACMSLADASPRAADSS